MLPELREITDELYKNCFLYEVITEKPKRKRFYKNYISRRKKMREFISLFELLFIKSQFENLSKKEQKKVIKLLKSKFIDTSDLKVKEND